VVDDAVGEGCGGDAAAFGFVDEEVGVRAGSPASVTEGLLDGEEIIGSTVFESRDGTCGTFSAAAFAQAVSRFSQEVNWWKVMGDEKEERIGGSGNSGARA
jgi:hypothetical protein